MEHPIGHTDYLVIIVVLVALMWGECCMASPQAEFIGDSRWGAGLLALAVGAAFATRHVMAGIVVLLVAVALYNRARSVAGYSSGGSGWLKSREPCSSPHDFKDTVEYRTIKARVPNTFVPIYSPRNVQPTCGGSVCTGHYAATNN